MAEREWIAVLDFGSQYTQLIARRVREANVFCRIIPAPKADAALLEDRSLKGAILSGGPSSVFEDRAPGLPQWFDRFDRPSLGICYGMQVLVHAGGGAVGGGSEREYGPAELEILEETPLLHGVSDRSRVWMSHGDRVREIPGPFHAVARTGDIPYAAITDDARLRYGVQFHPEVNHTAEGKKIFRNFLYSVCGCRGDWTPDRIAEREIARIKEAVGDGELLCAVSGGVDSTVVAHLAHKAIGDRLRAVFVDNGLLRKGEKESVIHMFRNELDIDLDVIEGEKTFLDRLDGVSDPEEKRRIIGRAFIDLFQERAKGWPLVRTLAQGTLYPDVIESVSTGGPSAKIKTHHNVGGLPETLHLDLVEPLRELFKDEVRELGGALGIPAHLLGRHPFPGPGLGVRILGPVTREGLETLRECDDIWIRGLREGGEYDRVWQAFAVLLPISSVGVMGDCRTYEQVVALRAVTSTDGMTADWARLPHELIATISTRILNGAKGVNRVVYDVSSKPPATIEWE